MAIRVTDHAIGDNRYCSFASEGLIEEYEVDFLGLKMRGTAEAKRKRYKAKSGPETTKHRVSHLRVALGFFALPWKEPE